jgi:hypothetical protein
MKKPKRRKEHDYIRIDETDPHENQEPTLPLIHMYI